MSNPIVTNPRAIERLAWLAALVTWVLIPVVGAAVAAPWWWYVYATGNCIAVATVAAR